MRFDDDEGLGEEEFASINGDLYAQTVESLIGSVASRGPKMKLPQPLDCHPLSYIDLSPIKKATDHEVPLRHKKLPSSRSQPIQLVKPATSTSTCDSITDRLEWEIKRYGNYLKTAPKKSSSRSQPTITDRYKNKDKNQTEFTSFELEESRVPSHLSSVLEVRRRDADSPLFTSKTNQLTDDLLDLAIEKSCSISTEQEPIYLDNGVQTDTFLFQPKPHRSKKHQHASTHIDLTDSTTNHLDNGELTPFRLSDEFKNTYRTPLDRTLLQNNKHKTFLKKTSSPAAQKAPFLSSGSSNGLSHAIHANEQMVKNLVIQRFPHWKPLIFNLLCDPTIGDNVAIEFKNELMRRKRIRQACLSSFLNEHQDTMQDDDRIISGLQQALRHGSPSKMQQLKIIYNVLHQSL